MRANRAGWVRALGQWLLSGAAGAALCLGVAVVLSGPGYLPTLWASAVSGLEWGLIGALELGLILWLLGRVTRRVRRGEPVVVAMCALALPFVANQWLHLALGEALRPRLWWLVPVLLRRVPSTSQHWTEFAAVTVGTLGGVVVAAILWGRPQRSRGVAVRDTALTALAAVGIVAAVWWGLFRPVASRARVSSCLSNQKSLGLAFLLYAQDYDDRLPPGRTSLELLGLDGARYRHALRDPLADPLSEALGGGPMDTYSKNHQVWFCPADGTRRDWRGRLIRSADPGPAVSYVWHASLAGRRVETIRTPSEEWLLRDREPWHNGRRVLVFVDGHAARDTGP